MRIRGLLVAVVLLAGLGVGLYFSNKQKAAEAAKPPSNEPPKLVSMTESDISKIAIQKKGQPEMVLQRTGGKWQITAPMSYPADQDAANQLSASTANVSSDALVENKASDLSPFGLNSPMLEVEVTGKGGKVTKLEFGDQTPTNSGNYAMVAGDPRVFTVASYVESGFDKSVNDLRDKRLLTFDQDKLSRVDLIAKHQDIEFGRDKDQWQIVKPKPLRADGSQVDEMIRRLKDARMDLSLTPEAAKKIAADYATAAPVATVKFTDASGTQQIEIRKGKDDYFAKSSAAPGVYKVSAEIGTGVNKSLDDFRNKKLFDFGFNDPSRIDMHINGKAYDFQKGGDDWFADGKKLDSISVQSFLDKLRDFSANKFIDAGKLGAPADDITVDWKNGKTNETEKVLLAKQGSDYVAQRVNEAPLYGLNAKSVNDLAQAASDVKPAQASPKKK